MKEFTIKKPYAECYEVKHLKENNINELRIWCSQYPDTFTLQIRTFEPIVKSFGRNKNPKRRNMIAHLDLSIKELEQLLEYAKGEK